MIKFNITNRLHIKALEIECEAANEAARQAVIAFNAALPAWYEGGGGDPVVHPDTMPEPEPKTVNDFAVSALAEWLDGKVKANQLDVSDLDARIAVLQEARAAALAVVG